MRELECDCDCESTWQSVQEYKIELTADDKEQLIRDKIRRAMQYVLSTDRLARLLDQ